MTVLRIDLETFSSVNLKDCGVYKYVESPDFEILLFGYAWGNEPVTIIDLANLDRIPEEVEDALFNPSFIKKAYNAAFERTCLAQHFGWVLPAEQWRCTSVQALYFGLPNHLKGVANVLQLDIRKDAKGEALIKYFTMPCKPSKANGGRTRNHPEDAPAKWEEFKTYCRIDVEVEREVDRVLSIYPFPESEWRLWAIDQEINDRGVYLDRVFIDQAIAADEAGKERLMQEGKKLSGLSNPNSIDQLKAWLERKGLHVPDLAAETISYLFEQTDDPVVKRMLEIRQDLAKTSVKKYEAMTRCICWDERARGLLQFYGANRTGREAGRLIQVQNLPRNDLPDLEYARQLLYMGDIDTLEMLYGSIPNVLSQLLRTALIAAPGTRLIVSDFSAIEARVLAWLANEKWVLKVFAGHGKIYEAAASQMFRVPFERIVRGNPEYELRQKGKVGVLACGYQGGPKALESMGALDMGLKEEELPGIVKAWRKANPNIVQYWYTVGDAAIRAVRDKMTVKLEHGISFIYKPGYLFIELPTGRRLSYINPKIGPGDFGRQQLSYEGTDDKKQWVRLRTYGGKLVENITQAVARDCLMESLERAHNDGFRIVFHVHDELVTEMPVGSRSLQELTALMGQPISWAPGLPLKAAGFETTFYMKD